VRAGVIMLLAGSLGACTTLQVRSDYDAAADISTCRSYDWAPASTAAAGRRDERSRAFDNPLNDVRLRNAIAKRLAARGMQPVAAGGTADCLVGHAIGVRDTLVDTGPRIGFGIGTGWGWGRRGFASSSLFWDNDIYAYREGRISVDIYKASNRDPIWHADVQVDVTRLTGANAEQRIDTAVTAMFARYPAVGQR
jgi:hypothetical protein